MLTIESDHTALRLSLYDNYRPVQHRGFKFENAWLREEDLHQIVENSWVEAAGDDIVSRLSYCAASIDVWGKGLRSKYRDEICSLQGELEALRPRSDEEGVNLFTAARMRLNKVLAQKEDFWHQRAKAFWLKGGDCNTK